MSYLCDKCGAELVLARQCDPLQKQWRHLQAGQQIPWDNRPCEKCGQKLNCHLYLHIAPNIPDTEPLMPAAPESGQFYIYGTLIGAREQDCMYVAKVESNPMLPPLVFPITRHMFETLRNGDRFKITFQPIEK